MDLFSRNSKNFPLCDAVPSILIVAPKGNINLVILVSILLLLSKFFKVIGMVAAELALAKAVVIAWAIPDINEYGFFRTKTK